MNGSKQIILSPKDTYFDKYLLPKRATLRAEVHLMFFDQLRGLNSGEVFAKKRAMLVIKNLSFV
jgi:hypothetical protein